VIISDLQNADLYVDAIYGGSRLGHAGDDPLPKLLGVDNQAGFRVLGKRKSLDTLKLIILITSFRNVEWPDHLDRETGLFTYYGDRHEPGDLHETPRDGNLILRNLFDAAHSGSVSIPPILVFGKADKYRDMQFLGLAVPGAEGMGSDEDLVAVWRIKNGVRFQNYKSIFTILNEPKISRNWIKDIRKGNGFSSEYAPILWKNWLYSRKLSPLKAEPINRIRSKENQLPKNTHETELIQLLIDYYKEQPIDFERCAMEIAKIIMPQIHREEITRPWRDGGRDATGLFRIGSGPSSIDVQFSLEAKLYSLNNGVGVKQVSRLISRLRHRQFGIIITTSYISSQAYHEIYEDSHPIVVISSRDIAGALAARMQTSAELKRWLKTLTIY
jgi:hypothetical protein